MTSTNTSPQDNLLESSTYSMEVQFREEQGLGNENNIQNQDGNDEA